MIRFRRWKPYSRGVYKYPARFPSTFIFTHHTPSKWKQKRIYIYITSFALSNVYPNNTSSAAFANAIQPLHLDPSLEYEIGLANVLYPRDIYAITPDHSECQAITNAASFEMSVMRIIHKIFIDIELPEKIGDIPYMIRTINDRIINDIYTILKSSTEDISLRIKFSSGILNLDAQPCIITRVNFLQSKSFASLQSNLGRNTL